MTALAQGRGFGGGFGFGGPRVRNFKPYPNTPYDGRFNFVRVIYECDAERLLVARPAVVGARLPDSPSRTS